VLLLGFSWEGEQRIHDGLPAFLFGTSIEAGYYALYD